MTQSYQRVPGGLRGVFRGGSLWLTDGYLLSVSNARFGENYRRYYLDEIQALTLRKTPRFGFSVWVLVALLSAALASFVLYRTRFNLSFDLTLALTWIILGYTLYMSLFRSCVCHIQTAVSHDELPALHRLGSARRALDLLAERITLVQGSLPEDWAPQLDSLPTTSFQESSRTTRNESIEELAGEGRRAVPLSCYLAVGSLFLGAALDWWNVTERGEWGRIVNTTIFLASLILATLALAQTLRQASLRTVRIYLMVVLGFLGLELYTTASLTALLTSLAAYQQQRLRGAFAIATITQFTIGGELLLGAIGVSLLLFHRKQGQ